VGHLAGQNVGDGLDAPVGVPREAGHVIGRVVAAKVVQQQEGIEFGGLAEAEGALQANASAFDGGFGLQDFSYGTKRHGRPPPPYWELDARRKYSLQQVLWPASN
jgi:hypothetical protein